MSEMPFSKDVLRLAAEAAGAGRLPPPCRTGVEFNPACGDRATIDLRLEGGRIAAVAHETKACVLAQASASILGATLAGCRAEDVARLRSDVAGMLQGGPPPPGEFAKFAPLAGHPGRHKCVLLPIDAALKALSEPGEPG